ncbi:HEXXH motif-containing putative peptide modification protein [Micromonospora sp. NPDC005324]|uniref:aKG-HExxH-type peptide beta-hydroxylase n=1 Tax=Micromonospora sp. NPDC005324 TaxID=3157033 RepID=UPI0033ADA68C
MPSLEDVFTLPAITELRRQRATAIHRVLGTTAPAITPLNYALAHQWLEGAEAAARAADGTLLAWYRHATTGDTSHLRADHDRVAPIVINPTPDQMCRSAIAATPYYVVSPETVPAQSIAIEHVRDGFSTAATAGFGALLRDHAPIVCLLRRKRLHDTLLSWTITRLPGTVFTDHTEHPLVLARDLIHEAGHNWLSDALAACHVTIPDGQHFYSPWRATKRPAFGFLHACWAFPLTVLYAARVASTTSPQVRDFLTMHLRTQADHLQQARAGFQAAVTLVDHDDLRHRMTKIFDAAVSITAAHPA